MQELDRPNTHERLRSKAGFRSPMLILGAAMTLLYLVLGGLLLFNPNFFPGMYPEYRNIFAGMLLVYGLYRGWRIFADTRQ